MNPFRPRSGRHNIGAREGGWYVSRISRHDVRLRESSASFFGRVFPGRPFASRNEQQLHSLGFHKRGFENLQ